MKRFVICPQSLIPDEVPTGREYFSIYSSVRPRRQSVGHIAIGLKRDLKRSGVFPTVKAWDFSTIALSVAAADMSTNRSKSADGWTRRIMLDIHLCDPKFWDEQKTKLESIFRYLTGDFWYLNFFPNGVKPPLSQGGNLFKSKASCISLLSGGVDSLVGAIDLVENGEKPIFLSKIATGDKEIQKTIAQALGAKKTHFQWSYSRRSPNEKETSTRGRSIIFFAYALLAASSIATQAGSPVRIYVPENGFISLNIPLNSGRLGTLSTKTTHPLYLRGLQEVWDSVGLNVDLKVPYNYRFKTKGELLAKCKNKKLLKKLIPNTTSCGRYLTYKRTHCGRCVPCLARRAAFIRSKIRDTTATGGYDDKQYVFENLAAASTYSGANDVGAVAAAYLKYKDQGINSFIRGALSFSSSEEREKYVGVVKRGLDEIGILLKGHGIV